jgi:hypothetical protein
MITIPPLECDIVVDDTEQLISVYVKNWDKFDEITDVMKTMLKKNGWTYDINYYGWVDDNKPYQWTMGKTKHLMKKLKHLMQEEKTRLITQEAKEN